MSSPRKVPAPDGTLGYPTDIIVGSGFLSELTPSGGSPRASNAVVESVLPQVMRAMMASTVDAVSGRIERATSATAPAAALSFGGASTLSDALLANAHALGNDTFDLGRLLANSSFTLPLDAAGNGGGLFGNLTFWGSGGYRSISGGSPQSVDYDGSVTDANLGIDTKTGRGHSGGRSCVAGARDRGLHGLQRIGRALDLSDQCQPLCGLADGGWHEPVGHGRLWHWRGGDGRRGVGGTHRRAT